MSVPLAPLPAWVAPLRAAVAAMDVEAIEAACDEAIEALPIALESCDELHDRSEEAMQRDHPNAAAVFKTTLEATCRAAAMFVVAEYKAKMLAYRRSFLKWHLKSVRRACAPGGAARKRDRVAYDADMGSGE